MGCWAAKGHQGGGLVGTYCGPREGHVVTVLLPGLVEALCKLLEESVGLAEDGKAQNVDSDHPRDCPIRWSENS